MRFTLVYEGPLASGGKSKIKHDLRCQIHPQLKALWKYEPLAGNENWLTPGEPEDHGFLLSTVDGHQFVSLVHPYLKLNAELDILLLRAETPGSIVIPGGDIDNRIKTLFDALRVPDKSQEVPSGWTPNEDQKPLFCLLADDKLISRVSVETDRLLVPLSELSHVKLVIRVHIRATSATYGNLMLVG